MNQNQTTDNDDLQKAIEDIAGATKNDPVFSDPVAAPSTIPEGDTGELGEPIGPFPDVAQNMVPTEPVMAPTPTSVMDPGMVSPAPIAPAAPSEPTTLTDYSASVAPTMPADLSTPTLPTDSLVPEPSVSDNTTVASSTITQPSIATGDDKVAQIKTAALRALVPIIDKLNQDPSQKFNLCRNILEELQDTSVLEPAYQTALGISDESERAEALLYLVESIDKM